MGGKPVIGVDTLPIEAKGSAYLLDGGPLFLDDMTRLGGAINAASGSLDTAGVFETTGASSGALGVMMGGGASGLATSSGSSPFEKMCISQDYRVKRDRSKSALYSQERSSA